MADGKQVKTNDSGNENRQEIKELVKSGKAFTFIGGPIAKAYKDEESGEYYVEAVSSSDQEDLVGDMFTSKALAVMKTGFIGKTAFMNHRTNVPDDVFGSIVATNIESKGGMQLLILKFVVEQENEPAMKTWRMLNAGRVELGTSVTVLVNSAKPNPARKGGIIIDDIEPIEVSIVGVPCNRESKTMTATATKALKIANLSNEDDPMKIEKSETEAPAAEVTETEQAETPATAAPGTEIPAAEPAKTEDAPAETEAAATEEKGFMPRTRAAIAKFKAMVAEVTESKVAKTIAEMGNIVTKGMFADMVAHPSFWDLVDILMDVRWALKYQLWNLQYAGETDFSEIEAAWAEALDEFKVAAVDSFNFWEINAGHDPEDGGDDDIVSMSLEEATQMEASIKHLAGLIESVPEQADELRTIGTSLLEIAAKGGIPLPVPAAKETEPITATIEVDVTKTEKFLEVATRAETAEAEVERLEKELSETKEELELSKAGLTTAVEAVNMRLREPLHAAAAKN